MSNHIKSILKIALFFIVGFTVLYLVYIRQQQAYIEDCALKNIAAADCSLVDKVINDIRSARLFWVFVALVLFMISNISRSIRWKLLLEPLGYQPKMMNALGSIMIGYMANLGIPRSGEFVRAGILSKYEGYQPEKVMGTIVMDRLADFVCLFAVIGITLIFSFSTFSAYFSEHFNLADRSSIWLSNTVILSALAFFIILSLLVWSFRNRLIRIPIIERIINIFKGFWKGILSIRELKSPWTFVFHSIIIWLCYFLMTYLIFFAFDPTAHLGPVAGLVVFVFGTLGIVFPSPGGMGSYHYLIGEGLAFYGINGADAFSFANILFFSIQIFCNILFGIIAVVGLPIYNEKRSDEEPAH